MNEDFLIESVGRQNPFKVPEGYFDTLASQIIAKVDAEGRRPVVTAPVRRARIAWLRPVAYAAAACVSGLLISVAAYRVFSQPETGVLPVAAVSQAYEDGFDEAADYVMIDNQDIYACLSSDY